MSVIYIRNKDGTLTPISSSNNVKTVNGVEPDENGNIEIEIPDSGGNVDVTFEGETMIISTANNAVKIDGETLIL